MVKDRSQLFSVQYLRGIAASLVVFAHTFEHPLKDPPHAFLLSGRYGVEIFFVISGFIITCSVRGRPFSPTEFMLRRIARVVPLYWLVTLIVAFLCISMPSAFKTTYFTNSHLLQSLLFIPHADPRDFTEWSPLHKPGWTLIYEMFFYSLMAFLFWCSSLKTRILLMTALIGSLILYGLSIPEKHSVAGYLTDLYLLPFLLGVWIGGLFVSNRGLFSRPSITLTSGVAFLIFTAIIYASPLKALANLSISVASTVLLIFVISLEEQRRFPQVPLLKHIGDSSYSLYLWHMFAVGIGWAVWERLIGINGVGYALGGSLIVISSVIGSYVAFLWIEKPLTEWLQAAMRKNPKAMAT